MRRLYVGANEPRSSKVVTARDVNQASAAVLATWRPVERDARGRRPWGDGQDRQN